MTGWLMLAYYIIGGVALIIPLGPSVLQAAGASTASTGPNLAITSAVIVVMLAVAVAGIRLTARTQIALAVVEYAILAGLAVAGIVYVTGTITAPSLSRLRGSRRPGSAARAAWPGLS